MKEEDGARFLQKERKREKRKMSFKRDKEKEDDEKRWREGGEGGEEGVGEWVLVRVEIKKMKL